MTNKIFLDGEGFDNNNFLDYFELIKKFLQENSNYVIYLYLCEENYNKINKILKAKILPNLILNLAKKKILHTDSPLIFRNSEEFSLVQAINACKLEDENSVIISAGNSGAYILALATKLKKVDNSISPAFMSIFPTLNNSPKVVLDLGSNLNPTFETLQNYARQGTLFNEIFFECKNSKVYLLNNGTEQSKGTKLHKEAYEVLKKDKSINFIGNIEARDILTSDANVIVTDGWSGNLALKAIEGTASFIASQIKSTIKNGNIIEKIAGVVIKKKVKKMFQKYNHDTCAFIIGFERICIKLHGSSNPISLYNSLNIAKQTINKKLITKSKNGNSYGH